MSVRADREKSRFSSSCSDLSLKFVSEDNSVYDHFIIKIIAIF